MVAAFVFGSLIAWAIIFISTGFASVPDWVVIVATGLFGAAVVVAARTKDVTGLVIGAGIVLSYAGFYTVVVFQPGSAVYSGDAWSKVAYGVLNVIPVASGIFAILFPLVNAAKKRSAAFGN